MDDLVSRPPPRVEREVEARQRELEPDDLGSEHANRLFEELLAGLVALEDGNRARVHGAGV